MFWLKLLRTKIYAVIEALKGVVTVTEVERTGKLIGSITGFSVSGYEITIYCEKKSFHRVSDGLIQSQTEHSVYFVYSTVGGNAPEELRNACSLMVPFPSLVHESLSDNVHSTSAINAYLDLLKGRLTEEHKFNS